MDKMKKVKKKRKMAKNLTLPLIFEQHFPAQNFNFEGDYIIRAHVSEKISTLQILFQNSKLANNLCKFIWLQNMLI